MNKNTLFCRDCLSLSSIPGRPRGHLLLGLQHTWTLSPHAVPLRRGLASCKRACKLLRRIPLSAPSKHKSWMKPTSQTMPSEQEGPWAPQRPSRARTQDITCGAAVAQTPVPRRTTRGEERTKQRKTGCMSCRPSLFQK